MPVVPVSILGHDTRQQAADSCLQDRVARGAATGSWAHCPWVRSGNFMQKAKGCKHIGSKKLMCV